MSAVNPLVEKQYNQWVYPDPVTDIAASIASGRYEIGDPALCAPLIWPDRPFNPKLSILVAGCGTSQAPFLAYTNPQATVVGIDLSTTSLEYSARLKQKHNLDNLELHRLDLHKVSELGRTFDLVISCGVLHHLPDTQKGLKALAEVVEDDGVIHLMLYGKYARAGVYMIQEALNYLGLDQTPADVALTRQVLSSLPAWHAVQSYLQRTPDFNFDGGIVDTFLHKQDRAFSVPEVLELAKSCNLDFQCWLDNLHYYPDAGFPADHPVSQRMRTLPEEKQWAIVEILAQSLATHRFLLRKKGKASKCHFNVKAASFLKAIPSRAHSLQVEATPDGLTLSRDWHKCNLTGVARDLFLSIDGKTSIGELIKKHIQPSTVSGNDAALAFFESMRRLGHLYFSYN
jgi:SAM-dependent methyltransferase